MKILNKLPLIVALILLLYSCGVLGKREQVTNNNTNTNTNTNNTDSNFPLYSVKEGSIYDGDTLRVLTPNKEVKIRFACIDAPETKQSYGINSRDFLRSLLKENNNQVRVQEITKDRYGRTVAVLYLLNGEAVQEIQARDGMAFPYPQYKSDCPIWDKVESAGAIARNNRLGVWSSNNPEYPWEWRKKNK